MRVLGIETSCDETGIAIYDDKKGLLANQLYSQVKLHADYGGWQLLQCQGEHAVAFNHISSSASHFSSSKKKRPDYPASLEK